MASLTLLDRAIAAISPGRALMRLHARNAMELSARHYDAASNRPSVGWMAPNTSANAALWTGLERMRARAREVNRNDPWLRNGLRIVSRCTVGAGIVPRFTGPSAKVELAKKLWKAWAESKSCDAEGRSNFYTMQRRTFAGVVESGAMLVRQRRRLLSDGLPVPLQLQVLEPDYLDTMRDNVSADGSRVLEGIAFDQIGRRTGYWLFREHPGERFTGGRYDSSFVPADTVSHVYWQDRAGQVTGVPWLAPVLLRSRDFAQYEEAEVMRQMVQACFAGFVHDLQPPEDVQIESSAAEKVKGERIVPGMLKYLPQGKGIDFANPAGRSGYRDFATGQLMAYAACLGVTYEQLSGDYSGANFSSGRMAWITQRENVESWRWDVVIPDFCEPTWEAFKVAAKLAGHDLDEVSATWVPPHYWMVNPTEEIKAAKESVRNGFSTLTDQILEQGGDPDEHFELFAKDLERLDELGIVLDSDPRRTNSSGQQATKPADPKGAPAGDKPAAAAKPDAKSAAE